MVAYVLPTKSSLNKWRGYFVLYLVLEHPNSAGAIIFSAMIFFFSGTIFPPPIMTEIQQVLSPIQEENRAQMCTQNTV